MDNKLIGGIIGIVSLLLGFGGSLLLNPDQLAKAYVCTSNEKIGVFDRLSSTSKTGYYLDNGVEKSSVCTSGLWLKLEVYAQSKGVSIEQLLQSPQDNPVAQAKQYLCNSEGCVPL